MTFWNLRRKRNAVAKAETKAATEKVEKKPTTKAKGAK
jgi:hypothetical protein